MIGRTTTFSWQPAIRQRVRSRWIISSRRQAAPTISRSTKMWMAKAYLITSHEWVKVHELNDDYLSIKKTSQVEGVLGRSAGSLSIRWRLLPPHLPLDWLGAQSEQVFRGLVDLGAMAT